jgi:hypothetical protein
MPQWGGMIQEDLKLLKSKLSQTLKKMVPLRSAWGDISNDMSFSSNRCSIKMILRAIFFSK